MAPGSRRQDPVAGGIATMTLLALASMLLFGTSFWGLVIVLEDVPPVTLGLLRALLVGAFMLGVLYAGSRYLGHSWMTRKRSLITAGIRGKRALMIAVSIALFSTALPNLFQNVGMTMMDPRSTSSLTALIQGISPVFTILLAFIFLRERMGPYKVIGLVIAIPATIVLTTYGAGGFSFDGSHTIGAFLNLLTAVSYSISGLLIKTALNRGARPINLVTVNAIYGMFFLFPPSLICWIAGWEDPTTLLSAGASTWLALFYVSIGLYGITAVIWYRVIRMGELSRVTFFVFLLPVFSYIIGYILLDERLGAVQLIAGVVLLAGVGISQVRKKGIITS
jgi:drug/metabolite transporter (DMT)-like permease